MISPAEIRRKAERKYLAFLRAHAAGEDMFPLRIPGRLPTAGTDLLKLQSWLKEVVSLSREHRGWGYVVEMHPPGHTRRHGTQSLPAAIVIPTRTDFLRLTGKREEFAQWEAELDLIRRECPALSDWAAGHPQRLLSHLGEWEGLLLVMAYFQAHPRPDLYLRDLPLELDTKFVEGRKGILRELLDQVLPAEAVDPDASDFEGRYGLRRAPFMVRFRLLDPDLHARVPLPSDDLVLPLEAFAGLDLGGVEVLVSENLMPYLTLPPMKNAIAVWGEGASVAGIVAPWLQECRIRYWGDLDVQGMQFLSRFRALYPGTESLMMDQQTLDAHAAYWVEGTPDTRQMPELLTGEEAAVYQVLQADNRRLEQERIGYFWRGRQLGNL